MICKNIYKIIMKGKSQNEARPLPVWVRFYVYGMHWLLDEIVFTAVFDALFETGGNSHLKGCSTLFSFFIYGSCSFALERAYVFLHTRGFGWPFRMLVYLVAVYTWEFIFGLILRQFGACSWDYSHYPMNLMGLITLVYAPAWFVACAYQDIGSAFMLSLRITTEQPMTVQDKNS